MIARVFYSDGSGNARADDPSIARGWYYAINDEAPRGPWRNPVDAGRAAREEIVARVGPEGAMISEIKSRKYECFIEDHEPLPWTPGICAGYAGRGVHLMRCKRKDGHGLAGLFCRQHAKRD